MSVSKHSPTLFYGNSRSFPLLLFVLAMSLDRPQAVTAAPSSETPGGQGSEHPRAIEQEMYRLFLWLTSPPNMHPGSDGSPHRKRDTALADFIRRILAGNNWSKADDDDDDADNSDGENQNRNPRNTRTTTQRITTQDADTRTTTTSSQDSPTSAPIATPPPQAFSILDNANSGNLSTQLSGAMPSGGNPSGNQQHPPNSPHLQDGRNTSEPASSPGMVTTVVVGGGSGVDADPVGPNQGLVIGLVISLVILVLLGCGVAAWFVRRTRKRRREREQISTQDDTAPWIWKREGKHATTETHAEKERYSPSPVQTLDSRVSLAPSAVSQLRARTPGGSPAIPVPYNPSEISDDVSAHFTLMPQDHKIGVPVPYPLALHVPSRVAKAMSERDEQWQQYETFRKMQGGADDSSETSTIPRPPSRMPQRRSTLRSVTSSRVASLEAYGGIDSRRNSRHSTWDHEGYSISEIDHSRSEIAAADHRGGQSARSSIVSDFPTPPLPSLPSHRRDGSYVSNLRFRRLPPLPGARTSNDGFPFPTPADSPLETENPFLTDTNVNASGMKNISEEPSSLENSDEMTGELGKAQHTDETPVVGAVTGVARSASARTLHYLGRTPSNPFGNRLPASQNPFNDGPSRFSAADSIDETVDTHQIHGIVSNFPVPPNPTRRLL